ncbi:MAG: hypothetical protein D6781_00715 [Verrucomicrobia bacterium]|nr:MAG: hypothetical protein D6781_00715 [Verrucomicrobiota bacterium]
MDTSRKLGIVVTVVRENHEQDNGHLTHRFGQCSEEGRVDFAGIFASPLGLTTGAVGLKVCFDALRAGTRVHVDDARTTLADALRVLARLLDWRHVGDITIVERYARGHEVDGRIAFGGDTRHVFIVYVVAHKPEVLE